MSPLEEFQMWRQLCLTDPALADREVQRVLNAMCDAGNPYAIAYRDGPARQRRPADVLDEIEESTAEFLNPSGSEDIDGSPGEATPATYPVNWSAISLELKELRGWRCEMCKFQKWGSSLIQVNHIDGNKGDNSPANLQVLCCKCHARQHGHGNSPIWPAGVAEHERLELLGHHARAGKYAAR
jgi:hypothetical protein